MGIVAARIDNRLLHGIVATQWTPQYRPQRVMVIDDEYANDPTKKAGMKMAKPAGTALSIITEETARANFAAGKYDDHTVFVIARTPDIVRLRFRQDAEPSSPTTRLPTTRPSPLRGQPSPSSTCPQIMRSPYPSTFPSERS